jgi:FkbM family methyltransferase
MSGKLRPIKATEQTPADKYSKEPFGTFAPNLVQRLLIALAQNSFLKRGLFRGTISRLIMGLGGKPIDVRFRGCAYRLRGQNNLIEYGLLLNPCYNKRDIDFLIEGSNPGDNFVDLGSNIGLYTLPMAAAAGANGVVVAVDANPMMAHTLRDNLAASQFSHVRVFSVAVSDADGRADLMVLKDDVAIVHIVEKTDGSVPVRTLASIISECAVDSIYGLKIDIEGHEDKALVPFMIAAPHALLPKRIVIEHPKPNEDYPGCAAIFAKRGYELVERNQNNSFYVLKHS